MSPVNKEKILTLIGECRNAVAQLSSYANTSRAEILASPERLGNIKYQFIIAVEAAIDICQHLSAKKFNAVHRKASETMDIVLARQENP